MIQVENGRSYPDLEQLLKLSEFFDLTLDELLRGDRKMTNKLNWDTKKKKRAFFFLIVLTLLAVNFFLSTVRFTPNGNQLEVENVRIYTDHSYNGRNPYKDWNSVLLADIGSKNIFFKPTSDSFLVMNDNNKLVGHIKWSFNIFNIFKLNKKITVNESILLNNKNNVVTFKMSNSEKTLPVKAD